MLKATQCFTLLCSLALLIGSQAEAKEHKIKDKDVVGSYIGLRGSTPDDATMDQFILNRDHTAWYYQSSAFNFPISTGTFSPGVGTWKICNNHVLITVVEFFANPTPADDCCDLNLAGYNRFTQEYKFIDCNTLQAVHRAEYSFDLDQNPVTDQGTLAFDDTQSHFLLQRVLVLPSDLNISSHHCSTSSSCSR